MTLSTLVPRRYYPPNGTGSAQSVQHGRRGTQPVSPLGVPDDSTTTTPDDRSVLLRLFRQFPGNPERDSPTARSNVKWLKWTGWSTDQPMVNWQGVRTKREHDDPEGAERVTSLVLPRTGLQGK